ncbi:MAG: regulatory protein GemA, partial [Treponema sp.]|nr:regulatory protein GemA [Treponema sp.]
MGNAARKIPLPISNRKAKLSLIHIAKKDVGITDEAYRSLLSGTAGVESAAKLEYEYQFNSV